MSSATQRQLDAISATERVCSTISLIGTFVILTTFIGSRGFRKPINRLVFYACWGNIMTNIATLISQDGIHAGVGSPLCQLQAFLIQWFMPADALWTFAMACNVYLTFFHKYNSEQLRRLEWKYAICCYGLPFIPAFVYFFRKIPCSGASLRLRYSVFYGPVWFVISLTFAIYLRAGTVIFQKRSQLRNIGAMDSLDTDVQPEAPFKKLAGIHVISEIACSSPERRSMTASRAVPCRSFTSSDFSPYSVTIEGGSSSNVSGAYIVPYSHGISPIPDSLSTSKLPPSPLRTNSSTPKPVRSETTDSHSQRRAVAMAAADTATCAYFKCAILFFIALLVTWVPSTINRVYALAYPEAFVFGLNYASSFVLPLQGFWNCLIYVSISWPACKSLWADMRGRVPLLSKIAPISICRPVQFSQREVRDFRVPHTMDGHHSDDSMQELARVR
ncbi:hypothetical protein N7510_003512 [Penicillium lagena]|uniref:uncharacterized protein n=1 Tax=Penicillium lagena TaxID=94218 RepID=UPI0025406599|nr:uncharacterized protein N7510_003512 [Penicillium lagena]KAJ5619528.1 hypothetical protein N7510_003512 [Penicillium lagena]